MIPVRLRSATDKSIGTTAFFRNRPLLDAVCHRLGKIDQDDISVLFHACSIGAEVYSFLIAASLHPVLSTKNITVSACDHEADFLEFGRLGVYPKQVLSAMQEDEAACFETVSDTEVRVSEKVRRKVTFLPSCSMQDYETDTQIDVVFLLNALLYAPASDQSQVIVRIRDYNRHVFVTTGFHINTIKRDMQLNGYRPYPRNARAIHDGWLDRRKPAVDPNEVIPGKIFHHWSLPPYKKKRGYQYHFCAIFEKVKATS